MGDHKKRKKFILDVTTNLHPKLKVAEKVLFKFCHREGCEDWDQCPLQCTCKVSKKLNLVTASAWNVAHAINGFIFDPPTRYGLSELKGVVETTRQIITYHMCDDRSRWLQSMLGELDYFIYKEGMVDLIIPHTEGIFWR